MSTSDNLITTIDQDSHADVELVPDPERIINGLRDTGYDFNTAIADIIDNSIAAEATKINILIDLTPAAEGYVYISDNGTGMDEAGLLNAMKYGSKERANKSSLGKFGLGLKTASTAFCKCLSVISIGSDRIMRKVQWDLDHVAIEHDWKLRRPEINEDEQEYLMSTADENGTGTLVVWEKIDRLFRNEEKSKRKSELKRMLKNLRQHLSVVYQRFLDPDDNREPTVKIVLNDESVIPWDPFCSKEKNSEILFDQPVDVETSDAIGPEKKAQFHLRAVCIPKKNEYSTPEAEKEANLSNDLQGFYVYREGRLIHYGDWMGMYKREPHFSLLRIELSFDHKLDDAFFVDIKKSRIILNDTIFNWLKDQVLPSLRNHAEEVYRKGKKEAASKASLHAHDDANKNIDSKADGLQNFTTKITDKEKGTVEITNPQGPVTLRIKIQDEMKKGQCRIIPVDNIEDNMLWEPTMVNTKPAVNINTGHIYYQKVYGPILKNKNMVTGIDSLLWALGQAEWTTVNAQTKDQYEEMRLTVSRILRRLVEDLPEVDFDDGK